MRKILITLAAALAIVSPAKAADSTLPALTAASAFAGTDLFYIVQSGATVERKGTPLQMAAYVYGLMSGDATTNGTGTFTLATVNGNVGTFGSATSCITTTQNAKGLTTAISATTCTPAIGSITGLGTGVGAAAAAALNGSTGLIGALTPTNNNCVVGNGSAWTSAACPGGGGGVSSIAGNTGAFTLNGTSGLTNSTNDIRCSAGSSSQFGCVKVDNTRIVANAGVISAGGVAINPQTGTNYAIVASDFGKLVQLSNASAQTPTLPVASTPGANWVTNVCNIGAGIQTITPTTSTIGGAASYALRGGSAAAPVCVTIQSDGTNYNVIPAAPATVASGTSALGTGAISSATCATVVTTAATGVLTTDVVNASFNGDPTAVTGYVPLTSGMLTIIGYPTAGNVNFKVCNNTSSSVTPGAITLNWRVTR